MPSAPPVTVRPSTRLMGGPDGVARALVEARPGAAFAVAWAGVLSTDARSYRDDERYGMNVSVVARDDVGQHDIGSPWSPSSRRSQAAEPGQGPPRQRGRRFGLAAAPRVEICAALG